jgi:hypothetical protein
MKIILTIICRIIDKNSYKDELRAASLTLDRHCIENIELHVFRLFTWYEV